MMRKHILFVGIGLLSLTACKKDKKVAEEDPAQLQFSVDFDATLPRLGNLGEDVSVANGNAAQHPDMKQVSVHYIELAPDALTALNSGAIVYQGEETTTGGDRAVDFEKAPLAEKNEIFHSIDLSKIPPGTYNWLRVSLTYQKYDIKYLLNFPPYFVNQEFTGTLASFVGFNTFIKHYQVKDSTVSVGANKLQGYWAFESNAEFAGQTYGKVKEGDGAGVTVVNPISSTSPVPPGSCVVTGQLSEPLVITGNETENKEIVLAFWLNRQKGVCLLL